MTQSASLPPQIDRLSLLPNELLDHIFDLAYSIDTPSTGALSKHLLPFHITGIYRRIRLSKVSSFAKLVKEIINRPALAINIRALELIPIDDSTTSRLAVTVRDFAYFLRCLTQVQTLSISKGYPELSDILNRNSSLLGDSDLPALLRLSAPVPIGYSEDPIVSLVHFTTLRSLTLTGYNNFDLLVPHKSTPLTRLSCLTITGTCADDASIASLCRACPALTHLNLYAYDAVYVELLRELPVTLLCLQLGTIDEDGKIEMGNGAQDCSAELSRFLLLRSLSLDSIFSSELPTYLSDLRHLENLTLVGDEIFTVDLTAILSAPTRPPSLRSLNLRLRCIKVGSRLEVDVLGRILGNYEPGNDECQVSGDWELPEYVTSGYLQGNQELRGVQEAAEEFGVEVCGDVFEALQLLDVYNLELANIAIYRCFRYKTFEPYHVLQDELLDARLPPLDLDSLDPNNLELVKTDLVDEGWFSLSLKAGDE